jgi:hypothetical protein
MSKYEQRWTRRLTHASVVALAAALLVGTGASPLLDGHGAAARKRDRNAAASGDVVAQEIQSFANTTPITIADFQAATPYPSTIAVSGFETNVANVAITIQGFSHSAPEQADMLLVGPGGQTAIFWSDLGALTPVTNRTLTFDDNAPSQIIVGAPLPAGGTFQPTNGKTNGLDNFPPPAPSASGAKLGVFNGTDPNGTWRLFVMDQGVGDTGSISGGWSLQITSANGVPIAAPDSFAAQAGIPLTVHADGVLGNDRDPDDDALTAVLAGQPRQGSVTLQPDGGFTYLPNKKAKGTDRFTYLAQDATGLRDLATVDFQIAKAKKNKKGKGKGRK